METWQALAIIGGLAAFPILLGLLMLIPGACDNDNDPYER